VGNTPDDAELERLLRQLLRVVIPAAADPAARNGGAGHPAPGRGAAGQEGAGPGAGRHAAAHSGPPTADARAPGTEAARLAPAGPDEMPQVSGSEARALIELVAARGIAQGELAGLLGLEKSTVSRLAAGLERKGWVRRGRDEGNQRYVRLYLTSEGGLVAARVWEAWRSRQARILSALTGEERAGLAAGLRGLVRGLAAEGLLGDAPAAAAPGGAPAGDRG